MLFNSFAFAIFFPIVLLLYWVLPFRWRLQNTFLLIASYIFYGFWDWRFLSLIVISTIVDYIVALKIQAIRAALVDNPQRRAKHWLILSICTNLGILGFFKYFNFFVDSFAGILATLGIDPGPLYLNIILPVGISFYTFQTMSYTIDVYRGKMSATRDLLGFAVYVSFFPQLVAGPIERAQKLLPRILAPRMFRVDQFVEGLHLITIGLFKKVFVADNLAPVVDRIFSLPGHTGFEVIAAAYFFAVQIYCDFSGYSDIARGCAKCMGIELMLNFNYPYVAINPSDFWRRWHISLSSWLRDYLYISLGGNRVSKLKRYRNLALTMLLGGLWHGASWVFVVWGAYQGALLIGHQLLQSIPERLGLTKLHIDGRVTYILKVFVMFQLVCIGWIIFRAQSIGQLGNMVASLLKGLGPMDLPLLQPLLNYALPLLAVEFVIIVLARNSWEVFKRSPLLARSAFYAAIVYMVAFNGAKAESFIYFQF